MAAGGNDKLCKTKRPLSLLYLPAGTPSAVHRPPVCRHRPTASSAPSRTAGTHWAPRPRPPHAPPTTSPACPASHSHSSARWCPACPGHPPAHACPAETQRRHTGSTVKHGRVVSGYMSGGLEEKSTKTHDHRHIRNKFTRRHWINCWNQVSFKYFCCLWDKIVKSVLAWCFVKRKKNLSWCQIEEVCLFLTFLVIFKDLWRSDKCGFRFPIKHVTKLPSHVQYEQPTSDEQEFSWSSRDILFQKGHFVIKPCLSRQPPSQIWMLLDLVVSEKYGVCLCMFGGSLPLTHANLFAKLSFGSFPDEYGPFSSTSTSPITSLDPSPGFLQKQIRKSSQNFNVKMF